MYRPAGFYPAQLGDVEVVARGDELHLFHLTLPNHDVVAHLVSRDGLVWEPLPPALTTGAPGALDDDQIWTVSVTAGPDGRWHMLYTALSTREGGRVQRVLRAVSSDLVRWEKVGASPVEAAPSHYATDLAREPWVSWHDPKPIEVDGTYYAAICARVPTGPFVRRGAVGLFRSTDLEGWTVEAPLFAPRQYMELECPQVFRLGGRFYLTAAVIEDRSQRYWVAPSLRGPYRTPPRSRLAPDGHYAARVATWRGRPALFCWHRPPGPTHTDPTTPAVVPSPLGLEPLPDGTLACTSWPAWADHASDPAAPLPTAALAPACGNPSAALRDGWAGVDTGEEVWLWPEARRDLLLEATFELQAPLGGLVLGSDAGGNGLRLELDPGERRARLVRHGPAFDAAGSPWFAHRVLQTAPLDPPDRPFAIRVVAVGGEVEVSLGGRVLLATVLPEAPAGRLGLFASSGRVALTDARLTPLRDPGARA